GSAGREGDKNFPAMLDHSRAFIYRKAVKFPVVFRMSQPYCRGTQRPWIGKPGNENIGNIVGLLGPEDIVVSSVTKVSVIQREIRKGNISSYGGHKRAFLFPFSGHGILIFAFQTVGTDLPGGFVGNGSGIVNIPASTNIMNFRSPVMGAHSSVMDGFSLIYDFFFAGAGAVCKIF